MITNWCAVENIKKHKVGYDKETDILYVSFLENKIAESDEQKPGIIMDYDADGYSLTASFRQGFAPRNNHAPHGKRKWWLPQRTSLRGAQPCQCDAVRLGRSLSRQRWTDCPKLTPGAGSWHESHSPYQTQNTEHKTRNTEHGTRNTKHETRNPEQFTSTPAG